jgi:hypothetical protein
LCHPALVVSWANTESSRCLCSESMLRLATNFGREQLLSIGTCVGKFTKTERFHLSICFLDYLAQYAKVCGAPEAQPPAHGPAIVWTCNPTRLPHPSLRSPPPASGSIRCG